MTNDTKANPPNKTLLSPEVKREMKRRLNKIHSRSLRENTKRIDQMLTIIMFMLGLISVLIASGGYFGFLKNKEIKAYSKEAASILEGIRNRSKELDETFAKVDAEYVAEHPDESQDIERAVQQDPLAPVLEKFIAQAISIQRSGNIRKPRHCGSQ